jgi:hypothetical protein
MLVAEKIEYITNNYKNVIIENLSMKETTKKRKI